MKKSLEHRKNLSKVLIGKKKTIEHRKALSRAQKLRFKNKNEKLKISQTNKETRNKESIEERKKYTPKKLNNYTVNYIKENYKFFSTIEEIKEGKDGEVQVRCKKCRKWFIPQKPQLSSRIYALEKNGKDGLYLYCSKQCKKDCSLYNLRKDPNENKEQYYTEQEYQIFRSFVLERDNYTCQFCGELATIVHHERPQKTEPFFTLDPDYAWSCCKKCHIEKGHRTGTECSFGNLSNKIC